MDCRFYSLRPIVHALRMHNTIPPESTGVPETIQSAEEWRILGEKLRAADPVLYEQLFAMLVASSIGLTEGEEKNITESYYLT